MTIEIVSPELRILPLGGCGEIGLNATLLIDGQDVLLIDCGALLGVYNAPGVEKAVPGFEPLFRDGRRLAGVVLTHGHEDHIGALPALLAELDVPVFGTPLTMAFARSRLERSREVAPEARQQRGRLVDVPLGGRIEVGPFDVELIRVTHSLPDSAALYIQSRAGRVLHSGDFKLDSEPLDGRPTDVERLAELGQGGVDLLLSDSTNSERHRDAPTECQVALTIDRLVAEAAGRVYVTLIASHLHRLQGVVRAAKKHNRRVVLIGRAVENAWRLGVETGHLEDEPDLFVVPERIGRHARHQLLIVASGSQGEWQGGFHRVAMGQDAALRGQAGDRFIYSSRIIPGHERPVRRLFNLLIKQGIEVVTDRMDPVHCSGHAHKGDQARLLELVKPRHFVPIHGERSMLEAHAETAQNVVDQARIKVIEDGQSVVLTGGRLEDGPSEEVSQRALDGAGRVMDWGDVRDRNKIGRAGLAVCSVALTARGELAGAPVVTFRGRTEPRRVEDSVVTEVRRVLESTLREDDASLKQAIRSTLRRGLKAKSGIAPEVEVHLVRIGTDDGEPAP